MHSNSKYYGLMVCIIIAMFFIVPGVVIGIHNSIVIGLAVAIPAPAVLGIVVAIIFTYRYCKEAASSSPPRYHLIPTTDVEATVNHEYAPHWLTSHYDPDPSMMANDVEESPTLSSKDLATSKGNRATC